MTRNIHTTRPTWITFSANTKRNISSHSSMNLTLFCSATIDRYLKGITHISPTWISGPFSSHFSCFYWIYVAWNIDNDFSLDLVVDFSKPWISIQGMYAMRSLWTSRPIFLSACEMSENQYGAQVVHGSSDLFPHDLNLKSKINLESLGSRFLFPSAPIVFHQIYNKGYTW